ncbi:MAG: DUF3795 domain-containing protein [Smithellaceae bacterium]|nr:DUF3795 domain-containing protein [Smithellaceae bacterium]
MNANSERELTGYCGLYCGDCVRFCNRFSPLAADLLSALDKSRFANYAAIKSRSVPALKSYGEAVAVLDAIASLHCDTPCAAGGDGCVGSCPIKECVRKKNLAGCWECKTCDRCALLDRLVPMHGDAPRRNLKFIKKSGLNNWTANREKFYPWL